MESCDSRNVFETESLHSDMILSQIVFNDTVFSYKECDKKYIISFQVKHKAETKKMYTFNLESTKDSFLYLALL